MKTENVSQKELDDAKLMLKTGILNSLETNSDKLATIHSDAETPYDIHHTQALLDAIDKLTPDDIRAAANYVFAKPCVTSIVASQKTLDTLGL